jgi:hypothetical protein
MTPEGQPEIGRSGSSRLSRALYSLLRIHVEVAQREAARDQRRLFYGFIFFMIGGLFLLLMLFLGQALGVVLLRDAGLTLGEALGVVTGADLVLGLLLFWLGRRTLRGPVLKETRAVLSATLSALLDP